ncbi:MAG: alpha/beta hydrolase [Cyanobacteria bacterium REEB65]|nr:alpha/beta hydrolase [Cyanobacteria bacterium REEB65]
MHLMIADRLEAEYWPVAGAQTAAVVCHPHPLYGGTMQSHVVFRIADACRKRGISALRFNFRGVGHSPGKYDGGIGEQDDVRCALSYLAANEPDARLWLTGFSFGAVVGGKVGAKEERVRALLLVGLPITRWDATFLQDVHKPKAFISGDHDEFGVGLEPFVAGLPEPKRLWRVSQATHLFDRPEEQQVAMPLAARSELAAALNDAISFLLATAD